MKKEYKVKIIEILSKEVVVVANSKEEAQVIAESNYQKAIEDYVLNESNYKVTEIIASEAKDDVKITINDDNYWLV